MTRGKQTCKILKEIRQQIADANDIEYVTSECVYKGDCTGTCPKCEAEVHYLEEQLNHRRMLGKAVVVAGISLSAIAANATSTTSSSMIPQNTAVELNDTVRNENHIFGECPDQVASFPGGSIALRQFIDKNTHYPEGLKGDVQGRVTVSFYVEKDGRVDEVSVIRGLCSELDAEAVRVVSSIPRWIPGRINGKRIRMRYTITIKFQPNQPVHLDDTSRFDDISR